IECSRCRTQFQCASSVAPPPAPQQTALEVSGTSRDPHPKRPRRFWSYLAVGILVLLAGLFFGWFLFPPGGLALSGALTGKPETCRELAERLQAKGMKVEWAGGMPNTVADFFTVLHSVQTVHNRVQKSFNCYTRRRFRLCSRSQHGRLPTTRRAGPQSEGGSCLLADLRSKR